MSIFDKTINDFLKTQEESHTCNMCGKAMEFKEEHGFYQCKKCKAKDGSGIIKAPQVLIGVGNKRIKLFWTPCGNCGKTNVSDLSQEPVFQVVKTKTQKIKQSSTENEDGTFTLTEAHSIEIYDKTVWEKNKKQEKITCTSCNTEFLKKVKVKK